MARKGIAETRALRVEVEEERKSLKAGALEYGRKVDSEAKRITTSLYEIEDPLKTAKAKVDDEREAKRKAKEDAETARVAAIQARIIDIQRRATGLESKTAVELNVLFNSTFELEITEPVYQEYTGEANKIKDEVVDAIVLALKAREKLDKEDAARKVENERLEKIRLEQAVEAKRLADENWKIADEKAKLEADKKAEADRVARAQWEENAKKKAEEEARAKVEAEAKAKADEEERLRIEKIKREMLAPDKDKLLKWVASFNDTNIQRPSLKSTEAREILSTAEGEIEIILQEAAEKAEAL
jgi:hypothetical protein